MIVDTDNTQPYSDVNNNRTQDVVGKAVGMTVGIPLPSTIINPPVVTLPALIPSSGPTSATLSPEGPRYVTMLTEPTGQPVGKVITIDDQTGALVTTSNIAVSIWMAVTIRVDGLDQMEQLLADQTESNALILDWIPGTEGDAGMLGEYYWLVSKSKMDERWQPVDGRPVHQLKKDNFKPGGWVCLDWDYDPTRPAGLCDTTYDAWWDRMVGVVPQIAMAGRLVVPSSKGMVLGVDGQPAFPTPSYHTYLMTDSRGELENAGKLIDARMWLADQGYYRRNDKGGILRRTPFDPCTFSVSRRVFESKPVIDPRLGLGERVIRKFDGLSFDLADLEHLTPDEITRFKRATDKTMSVHRGGGGGFKGVGGEVRVTCTSRALQLDMLVETRDHDWISIRDYHDGAVGGGEKLRCQTPFRDSSSWAGYLNRNTDGSVFLYDVGDGTKYMLDPVSALDGVILDMDGAGLAGVDPGDADLAGVDPGWQQVVIADLPPEIPLITQYETVLSHIQMADVDAGVKIQALIQGVLGSELITGDKGKLITALKHAASPQFDAKTIGTMVKEAERGVRDASRAVVSEIREGLGIEAAVYRPAAGVSDREGKISNPVLMVHKDDVGYEFVTMAEGRVEAVWPLTENLRTLCTKVGIGIWSNLMSHNQVISIPGHTYSLDDPDNHALSALKDVAIASGMPVERLPEMVNTIANENQYHPVVVYLDRLRVGGSGGDGGGGGDGSGVVTGGWDGKTDWIGQLASFMEVEKGKGKEEVRDTFFRKWLLSGVAYARGWDERTQFAPKGVLTLAGDQHIGKTSFLRRLCPSNGWFLEGHLLQPGVTDSERLFASHFLVELGEVDSTFRKADIAALKAFLSKSRDKMRLPYERKSVDWRRRTLACATVNEQDFLVDKTGNSRFWPIEVLRFDFAGMDAFYADGGLDKVWGQADALFAGGESWLLNGKDEIDMLNAQSEEHRQISPLEQAMLDRWDWEADRGVWRYLSATAIADEFELKPSKGGHFGVGQTLRHLLRHFTGQKKANMLSRKVGGKTWKVPPRKVNLAPMQ